MKAAEFSIKKGAGLLQKAAIVTLLIKISVSKSLKLFDFILINSDIFKEGAAAAAVFNIAGILHSSWKGGINLHVSLNKINGYKKS